MSFRIRSSKEQNNQNTNFNNGTHNVSEQPKNVVEPQKATHNNVNSLYKDLQDKTDKCIQEYEKQIEEFNLLYNKSKEKVVEKKLEEKDKIFFNEITGKWELKKVMC